MQKIYSCAYIFLFCT